MARLTYMEAYEKFKSKFPETKCDSISDFGDFYLCSNAASGDMVDDDYKIDPITGEIKSIDFLELTEEIKKHPNDEDIKEYRIRAH